MASKRIMRYKCPYCEKRMERKPLVIHVEDKHDDMIPEGYTAFRVVFNYINKKPLDYNGKCTECGGPTRWDEEKGRYDRQCSNPKCKESYLKKFEENMMRTRGVTRMSQTAEGQKQMLANRKISGTYKFQDGGVKTYTGSYELKALEFMDKILEIKSDDILAPGPILEYSYQGKTHIYITDFYYQPYNLIIEVKDGGNNPNKRDMPEYRAKQIAKEQYIIKHTNYNYLRLTNNDFGQLMTVFADLKYEMQENTGERVIHVNEDTDLDIEILSEISRQDINSKYLEKGDICYNLDKWPDEYNILFITGISGSGKTTLGIDMTKEFNCNRVELDYISAYYLKKCKERNAYNKFRSLLSKECPEAVEFLDLNPVEKYGMKEKWSDTTNILQDFCDWFTSKVLHNGKSYIVNGAFLVDMDHNFFYDKPLILKDINYIKTVFRRTWREFIESDKSFFDKISSSYHALKTGLSKEYRAANKKFKDYRNDMNNNAELKESYVEERVAPRGEVIKGYNESVDEILSERSLKADPVTLYHGSHHNIKNYIAPKNDSYEDNNYVFATTDRLFALCFAGNPWHDGILRQSYYNGKLTLTEEKPGFLNKIFDTDGYIYTIDNSDIKKFTQRKRVIFTSTEKVKYSNKEYIPNVLEELENSNIEIYKYPNKPFWYNKSINESVSVKKKYYHVSQSNLDGKTLQPSIPNNYFTKNGYEDNKIKRVCFTDSIDNCLRALSQKCTGMELYVHILDGNYNVYTPSIDEVPDCKVTGEVWVTKPCKVKCIGKIKVIGDRGEDGLPFKYGNKTAELYDWDWEWIEQLSESKDVSTLTDGFKKKSEFHFRLVDINSEEALKYITPEWRNGKDGRLGICIEDNYLAGYIYWRSSVGTIGPIRVYDHYKENGLGETLLREAIKNGGYKLGVYTDNQVAISLYKKLGFVEVGRKTYKDGDEVIMMELQSKINESSLTEAKIITVNESAGKIYYRVTCNGEGIYEALKKAIGHDEWIKLLNDKAINWLPKPPKYNAGYESYFTKEGYHKFNKYTLPIILKYIDEDFIDVKKYTDSGYIVYRDKYQVVTSQPLLPVQEAYKEISDEAIDEAFNIFDFIIKKSNLSNNIKYTTANNKTQANTFENLGGALFNQVKLDHNNKQFIIKGINFEKFLLRLKEMYQYRGITKLFEKKYSNFELKLWKLGLKSKNSMKVRELNIPLYFALEMYNIFTALGDFYNLDFYKNIAKNIYRKTWVSNFEDRTDYKKLDTNIINNIFNSEYKLKDYQKTFIEEYGNFKYIYDLVGYILCFEQGLGKTLTSLALAETLKKDQIIIICPNSLKENWVNEIGSYYKIYNNKSLLVKDVYAHGVSRFTSSKNPKFIIVNQESIDKISNIVKKGKNSIIIVDEIHNFRNIDSDRSKALINLKESIDCKDNLLMSGTPIKANATEIIPMLRMIDPYFTEELANIYKKAFNNNTIEVSDVVKTRFSRIIYRKTKDEVLSLPNKTISNLELPCKNSSKYISSVIKAEIVKEIKAQIESRKDSINKYKKIFEEMVLLYSTASHKETKDYLKYIAAIGSEYVDEDEADYQAIIYKNFLKTNVYPNIADKSELKKFDEAKTNYVYFKQSCIGKAIGKILPPANTECYKDIFDDNINVFIDYINKSTKKTVIFTPFLEVANYVNDELNKKGIGSVKIVGNVSNRMDIINKFKFDDSIDVLVATVQTLSTGVTLTEADQMFFLGVPYRKADFDQACDRIHRIGQTKDVSIYVVLLKTKEANITNRLSDIMNNSGESSDALIYFENTDIKEENMITEAISPSQYHPVYLISMSYKSPLEKPIELFTGSKYAHSTVVIDNDFDHMYSFNGDSRKTLASKFLGGFSAEPLGLFKKINPKGLFTTSVLFVKNADYKKLKDRLTYYIDNSNNTKYNFAGLLNVPINRETITKENRMFCSQFVDALFKFINVDITGKSSNTVSPKDIANIQNKKVYNIYTGNIENFDPQQCIKLTKKLSKTSDYIKEEFEFVEAAEILNEGVIRNEPDVMYNKKLFDAGDINLCFVVGHSGSGKSTYAKTYAKSHSNTEVYELDDLVMSYKFTDDELKEYGDLIYTFFKKNPKYRIPTDINTDEKIDQWCKKHGWKEPWYYCEKLCKTFVEYAKNFAKIRSKKYIIEGVQLFMFFEPKEFNNYAFYIKGTSALLSWIRGTKRDGIKSLKTKLIQLTSYGFFEKQLYKFRDYFVPKCRDKGYGEDSMSEAAFNELMSAIGYAPVVGIEKSDAYIVNYMSNNVFSGEPSEGVKRDAIGVTNTRDLHDVVGLDDEQKLKRLKLEEVHNPILYKIGMTNEQVSDILYSSLDTVVDENFIYESLTNQTVYGDVESQAKATLEAVSVVDMEKKINKICENYLLPPDDIDIALSDLEAQVANMKMDIYNE